MNCPNTWLSGSVLRNRSGCTSRSYFKYFCISRSIGAKLASTLRCVCTTPFGSPVVPDVKTICSVSSAPSPSAGASRGSCGSAASKSSNASRGALPSSVRSNSRPPVISFGLTSPTTLAANSGDPPASSGTGTAPRSTHPKNAAIHSCPFAPQITTLSPLAMPRDSSSRA